MVTALIEGQPASTSERLLAAAGLLAGTAASAVVWYFNPSNFNFFPVCPLLSLTGFACPGCGMTRAFHAFFHGDIITALDFNALLPIFVLIFGFLFLSLVSVAVRGRGFMKLSDSPKFIIGLFVMLLVFGVLRNVPVYPLTVLYP